MYHLILKRYDKQSSKNYNQNNHSYYSTILIYMPLDILSISLWRSNFKRLNVAYVIGELSYLLQLLQWAIKPHEQTLRSQASSILERLLSKIRQCSSHQCVYIKVMWWNAKAMCARFYEKTLVPTFNIFSPSTLRSFVLIMLFSAFKAFMTCQQSNFMENN